MANTSLTVQFATEDELTALYDELYYRGFDVRRTADIADAQAVPE